MPPKALYSDESEYKAADISDNFIFYLLTFERNMSAAVRGSAIRHEFSA
jgi:hypothetical protein